MERLIKERFISYLSREGSARIRHRLSIISDCIEENIEINYQEIRHINGCGDKVIRELISHVTTFKKLNLKQSESSEKSTLIQEKYPELMDHHLNNFILYLIEYSPSSIQNKISKIREACKRNATIDIRARDVSSMGKKSIVIYNRLKKQYRFDYPSYNYERPNQVQIILKILRHDNWIEEINEWFARSTNLKFYEIRRIMISLSAEYISENSLDLSIKFIDDKCYFLKYVFIVFWLDTNPSNYALFSQYFDIGLSKVTSERRRQLFVRNYERQGVDNDILVFRSDFLSGAVEGYKILGQFKSYLIGEYIFCITTGIRLQGLTLPSQIPYDVVKSFASRKNLALKGSHDYTLITKQKKKRDTVRQLMEEFVKVYEYNSITSAHISEELEKYGYIYTSNYIPSLVKRWGVTNIIQRWNWTWVVRDGKLDIDPPECSSYTEFFADRILNKGRSFHQSIIELRKFYPRYTVKNGLALIGANVDQSVHRIISERMVLGFWCDSTKERKNFYVQIRFPRSFLGKIASWPVAITENYSVPRLVVFNNDYYWIFNLATESSRSDLIDYINAISFRSKVLFKLKETVLNIDGEEIDIY